jgi:hypothetical protein
MSNSATVAENLRGNRIVLGVSQSKLARLSGVSRFKICLFELGDGSLTADEQIRIREALQAEAERLRQVFSPLRHWLDWETGMTKSSLNLGQRRTVEIIEALRFGVIERLVIRGGLPCFEPCGCRLPASTLRLYRLTGHRSWLR